MESLQHSRAEGEDHILNRTGAAKPLASEADDGEVPPQEFSIPGDVGRGLYGQPSSRVGESMSYGCCCCGCPCHCCTSRRTRLDFQLHTGSAHPNLLESSSTMT